MREIRTLDIQGYKWLKDAIREKWENCHDGGRRIGCMTTNMAEVFNNILRAARVMPITAFGLLIFYKVGAWFNKHRSIVAAMIVNRIPYGPNVQRVIDYHLEDARHEVVKFDDQRGIYSVKTSNLRKRGGNTHVVKIDEDKEIMECDCGKWLDLHIPCAHVLVVSTINRMEWNNYVSLYYKIDRYAATYAPQFEPIRDKAYWPSCDKSFISDKTNIRKRDHPQAKRIQNGMDISQRTQNMSCGMCQQQGHNRINCPNPKTHRVFTTNMSNV